MSKFGTFREVALAAAPKQSTLINTFLRNTPFLSNMPIEPTSNGLQHVFEKVMKIVEPQVVDLDAPLPLINAETELDTVNVSQIGGQMYVGEDKLNTLGQSADAYFDRRLRIIMPKTAMSLEKSLLVNSFLAYATANSNTQTAGGTNTGNMYSMLAVNWQPEEINGLYNPKGWGRGSVFDAARINGGALMPMPVSVDAEQNLGYGSRIKSQLGVQLANPRYVSAINDIDVVIDTGEATGRAAIPSEEQMDDMILNADGVGSGSTVIYMPAEVMVAMNAYKGSALQMNVQDTNFDRQIASWNGTPVVPTYNFGKTS